jgi:ubiquinone biosynthesis protein
MSPLDFLRLFRAILSPGAEVDAADIERMGLLAVKIAQMYAVRSDLLGPEKCAELSRLLQRTGPLSRAEFEQRWNGIAPAALVGELDQLDPIPLAAASLGQVHRATLRGGRQVVIKIAKRETRESFLRDVAKFRSMLKFSLFFYPKLERLADPIDALETVERQTLREMDFTAEIAGAQRLATLASEQSDSLPHLRRLGFPDYFSGFSNERLLVSGFVEGNTLAEWLDSGGLPYEALLDLFRIHGYFLFVRGEFHGDLHPGNVIWHEGNFWFLDNANIETVPPHFGRGIFQMMVLLGQGDLPRAADQLAALSLKPLGASQLAGFRSHFNALYQDFAGRTVAETSLTDQMMKTVKMAVHSGVTFPRGAFPLIKSLMYLDGMVLRAAPQAKLLRDVARFADDFPAEG